MDDGGERFVPGQSDATVAAAKARIRDVRMQDVDLRVLRRDGSPLAGAPVEAVQTRNAFPVGCNLWALDTLYRFGEQDYDRAMWWKHRFAEVFNAASAMCYWTERPRNDAAKTEALQGHVTYEGFAYCTDWAASQGLVTKGHPLFWSIQKCVPDWVKRYDYETQMKFAEVRVRDLVARFRGQVTLWDAVNEPMWEPAFRNLPDRHWPHLDPIDAIADYVAPVLRWCREEDPDACFIVNDYGMEVDSENGAPLSKDGVKVTAALQRKRFLELLACLQERGALPNALGLQSHTGGWYGHDHQLAVYDEMATSGLPIHITEFWAHTRNLHGSQDELEAMQADYVADYLTCAYSHPSIEGFFFWGFMDEAIRWGERSSHELTPLFHRVRDLLKSEWMTRETLQTNPDGVVRFTGHRGDYSLRYPLAAGQTVGIPFAVHRDMSKPVTLNAYLA